ncbi:hypothetical protein ACM66B_001320 [Microbotryomycetes sp. NB124-2]
MAPAAKGAANRVIPMMNPLPSQSDDSRYQQKYVELKVKLKDLEDDNASLALRVLQSKKAIQRLRLQRAILYDRVQQTTVPTNPYALRSATHLAELARQPQPPQTAAGTTTTAASIDNNTSASRNTPPTILDTPAYPTIDAQPRETFLRQLDATKLRLVTQNPQTQLGDNPVHGIKGERQVLDERRLSPEPESAQAEIKPTEQDKMQVD